MKEQILESVKKLLDSKEKKWEAGKDMVNYAGPYFDSSEITSAIESLLDGWLVMGKKCMKFEKLFPKQFDKGYGGVDIGPLMNEYPDMMQLGMTINSQEYFDYHHSEADVFEAVNKRELELGAAAMAAMIYLLDKNLK